MTVQEFTIRYVAEQKKKHKNNSYWQTDEQVIENLGGIDAIEGIYYLAQEVNSEAQRRIIGFTL